MTPKCMSIRATLCSTVLLSFFLMAAANANAQIILYQETFPWTNTTTQDLELRDQGWCGGNAGDAFCNNPPGTTANQGGEGAISVSAGEDGNPGFAFWSQTGINADSFLYTDEFVFDSSELMSVMWFQRDSGSDPIHLAFRIGTDWYISDQTWTANDSSTWMSQTADLSSLTFFLRSSSDPSTLPGGGVPGSPGGLDLPAGQINAFGFSWDGPKAATSRVDTVTLEGIDDCPDSDLSATVVIDGCDSGVTNASDASGCTIADEVDECADNATNHGDFVSCVSHLTNDLKDDGLISGRDKGAIQRCAAQADLP